MPIARRAQIARYRDRPYVTIGIILIHSGTQDIPSSDVRQALLCAGGKWGAELHRLFAYYGRQSTGLEAWVDATVQ